MKTTLRNREKKKKKNFNEWVNWDSILKLFKIIRIEWKRFINLLRFIELSYQIHVYILVPKCS